ncbi:MAG: fructose-6-phosphate aldolase [Anaerolineae bacterium]
MELWISGTIDEVVDAANAGLAAAIATNPTLIRQWTSTGRSLESVVAEVTEQVAVPVYVQLHGPTVDYYLREMDALRHISDLIKPKLVATEAGIRAAHLLAKAGLDPLITAVTTLNQAFMASAAGASYVAPYFGRIEDAGENPVRLIQEIRQVFQMNHATTGIIVASIRTPEQARAALLAGGQAVVVFYDVLQHLFESELTAQSIASFEEDWSTFTFENRADRISEPSGD